MDTRPSPKRHALALAGALVAALAALMLALVVNLGILRAAGDPSGPGLLSRIPQIRLAGGTIQIVPSPADDSAPSRANGSPRPAGMPSWTAPSPRAWTSAPASGGSTRDSEPDHTGERDRDFGSNDDD